MRLPEVLFLFLLIIALNSCIVQAPKYTRIEQVLNLRLGMTLEEVNKELGIPPYDVKSIGEQKEAILIYKYRSTERKTFPMFMKESNGMKATGKWVDLFVTFSKEGKVTKIESCTECEQTKPDEKKLDFNVIVNFLTISVPALLVYLGLTNN